MNKNKFRVWDPHANSYQSLDMGKSCQQFIGVLDKNLKEIYEGDVVKYKYLLHEHEVEETIGEVYFEEGIFYFDRSMEWATNDTCFVLESVEVIGTMKEDFIYNENGKLVRQEKL